MKKMEDMALNTVKMEQLLNRDICDRCSTVTTAASVFFFNFKIE